jgi:MFS superfamily sulfate permease-like transporter
LLVVSERDLLPWFTTFIVSLTAGFEYGIILGVVVSLMLLLYPWVRPAVKVGVTTFIGRLAFHLASLVHLTFYAKCDPSPSQYRVRVMELRGSVKAVSF